MKHKATKFTLPLGKKITLLPIDRNKSFMGKKNHDGSIQFTGTGTTFVLPMKPNGKYVNPLTAEEQEYLEEVLGINLNVHSTPDYKGGKLISGNVYGMRKITMNKTNPDISKFKRVFELDNPDDFLDVAILKQCPNIANSWKERDDTPEYKWVLREEGQEFADKRKSISGKRKAYAWFDDISDNKTKLVDNLRVLGENVTQEHTLGELESLLDNYINDPYKLGKVLDLMEDKEADNKIFVDKAIRVGMIKRVANGRYVDSNGEVIGNSVYEVSVFIRDNKNNVFYERIKEAILKAKL